MKANHSTYLRSRITHHFRIAPPALAVVLLGLALAFTTLPTRAADSNPPKGMTYQGYLTDGTGTPLGNVNPANYDIVFRIYDASSSGAIKWAEKQTVTIDKGQFSVVLGEGAANGSDPRPDINTVFSAADASDRFIAITVKIGASDVDITPRLRLVTSPYAFLAKSATALVGADGGTLLASGAPGQLTVSGQLNSTTFNGNGAALTALNASAIASGALADARLSANVPLLSGGKLAAGVIPDTITGNKTFSGLVGITGNNTLEFGAGIVGKEGNAGKIGYGTFTANVLDIVGAGGPSTVNRKIKFWGEGGSEFVGRVGIGTASPSVPLEVAGSVNVNKTFTYFAKTAFTVSSVFSSPSSFNVGNMGNSSGTVDYSIIAANRIGASEFNAFSDARIKRVVGISDSQKDLEIIRQLCVKDYYSVDRIADGEELKKGFIAQEVRTLIPEAVTISKRFVPDIYVLPTIFEHDGASQQLTITLPKAHQVKKGDRVQLFADDARLELSVVAVMSPEKFVLGKCEHKPEQVFVYGKEVPDFHTLNYDRIFTTGISAIQELAKRVESLEAREKHLAEVEDKARKAESLEREVVALRKQLAAQQESAARTEARFEALESMVKKLAQARTGVRRVASLEPVR